MNIEQLYALRAKIEECQREIISAAGVEACVSPNRMEAHIFTSLVEAQGYTQLLLNSAERAERAPCVFDLLGRIAA